MSDIAIFSDPLSIAFLYLVFGSPGLALGAVIGAMWWPPHRVWGAVIGAIAGFVVWIAGVWVFVVR
jgi:Na+/proline symporter